MHETAIVGFDPASFRNLGWSILRYQGKNGQKLDVFKDLETCAAGTFKLSPMSEKWKCLWGR